MILESINPATGYCFEQYQTIDDQQLADTLNQMQTAQAKWQQTPLSERCAFFIKASHYLQRHRDDFATLITQEMGKPITSARAEVEKCATVFEYYAKAGPDFLKEKHIETEFQKSIICYQPLGIIFGVMPWNYPLWQILRFTIPTLIAGNAVAVKHAPNCTGCVLEVEKMFNAVGFETGLFKALLIDHPQTHQLIKHDAIAAITFTGSIETGRKIAASAGAAGKKVILELGGSDPAIILKDADLDLAVKSTVASRLNNCGQVCISVKRFITVPEIHNQFLQKLVAEMSHYQPDDPMLDNTQLGPMARANLREQLHQQVTDSITQGARCLLGGQLPVGDGFYYPPTVLSEITPDMPAYDQELFGPVASVIAAKNEEDAIFIANNTRFGLGACIFTQDLKRGEKIARDHIAVGTCCVNRTVSSHPKLPFGGIKDSGFGRELGKAGVKAFVNEKVVIVD